MPSLVKELPQFTSMPCSAQDLKWTFSLARHHLVASAYKATMQECNVVQFVSYDYAYLRSINLSFPTIATCTENSIRLVGGRNLYEGRVEVCVLETWRTVCSMNWGTEDAAVSCRQLGFSRFSKN